MRRFYLGSVAAILAIGVANAQPAPPAQPPQPAPRPAAMCASADQIKQVSALYASKPGMPLANASAALKMPEAVVASALPKDQAVVLSGAEFTKLWETMAAWPSAVGLIMRNGSVFELPGKIMIGEQSTRSNFYNLKPGGGFTGHLRHDMMSTIAVVAIPGKDAAVTRGAFFYDGAGDPVFGEFVAGEGGEGSAPNAAGLAAFDKTMALAKTLPKACK